MEKNQDLKYKKNREIDVIGVVRKVWGEKKTLSVFVVIFAFIGVVVALSRQKMYTSSVYLAPEATSMGMSQGLGGIADMVGINIGSKTGSVDAIYPDLYPDVFASSDFIVKLFDIQVMPDKGSKKIRYYDHLVYDYKIPFWAYPKMWLVSLFKKKLQGQDNKVVNTFRLTQQQTDVCNMIRHQIRCQMSKMTNIIEISVTDVDPLIAATIADTLQHRLQNYITLYRTQKARNDLAYAQRLNAEAKVAYEKAQRAYAGFADANTDVILESFRTKRSMLEDQMSLRYNNLTETEQQIQKAKARVQERTPAFTVIQGATVPLRASSTPRSFVVIGYVIFGVILDAIWVLWGRKLFFRSRQRE